MSCDYILSAGYSWKIPIGAHRGLNIHPTLLPTGRGAWPFPRIILNGCRESGVTLHKLTDRFDAGDIVLQRSFPFDPYETQDTLHCKNQMVGPDLLREWLEKPEELWEQAVPQGKGKYWNLVSDAERTITPDMKPEQVNRVVRAFTNRTVLIETNDGVWYARTAVYQNTDHTCSSGTILYSGNGYLVVAVREGILYASQTGRVKQTSDQAGKRSIIGRILRRSKALLRQFL